MDKFADLFNSANITNLVRTFIIIAAGYFAAKVLARAIVHFSREKLSIHNVTLTRRFVFWGIFSLFAISALHQLGFRISVLMGAAGILSVAIGFASQTSASNLISGLFVLGERSFSIGDVVQVGSITGEVLSVDLLSVKLRTFDNLFVRIPNETMIKSEVITLTKFPIRRFDLLIGISYNSDISQAREVMLQVATDNMLCLEEPPPLFIIQGFNSSSIDIQFSVWATRENFLELKNSMQEKIKRALDAAGIEIPYPHLSIYTGDATKPFPVQILPAGDDSNQR